MPNLEYFRRFRAVVPHPSDWQKESIIDDLTNALPYLQAAYDVAQKVRLGDSHSDLHTSITEALNACSEALQQLADTTEE